VELRKLAENVKKVDLRREEQFSNFAVINRLDLRIESTASIPNKEKEDWYLTSQNCEKSCDLASNYFSSAVAKVT